MIRLLFCCLLGSLALAAPSFGQANTFLKAVTNVKRGYCMCPSGDGNFYVAGILINRQVILKMTPNGDILETYALDLTVSSFNPISEIIVDSEGMVVGCGYFNEIELGYGFLFRYNPFTHSVLWFTGLEQEIVNFKGIIEKSPGGDFLVYGQACDPGQCDGLLIQVDRHTGLYHNVGPNDRYRQGRTAGFNAMLVHDSTLYAVGLAGDLSTGFIDYTLRSALTRLDTAQGAPLWTRLSGAPLDVSARLNGKDLIVDGNSLLTLYSGNKNDYAQPSTTFFLQKHRLDGTIEWGVEYDLPEWENEQAEEIVAVPDGYVIYGSASHDDEGSLFVIKTDKEGSPDWSKKLKYGYSTRFFSGVPQQGQILAADGHLLFTATTQGVNPALTQMLLVKVSSDGQMGDSCDYWMFTPLIASDLIDLPDTLFTPTSSPETYNIVPSTFDPPYPMLANVVTSCQQAELPPQPFADTCQQAKTFLKYYGQAAVTDWGFTLCPAHDGTVYAAGLSNDSTFIMKVTPGGGVVWTRAFQPVALNRTYLSALIEDSDGMLVGLGTVGESDNGIRTYVFRYDPVNDTMLWGKLLTGNLRGIDLIEKSPGGNYLLSINEHLVANADKVQLWELNRLNGNPVSGSFSRYEAGGTGLFRQMIRHEGALYTLGHYSTAPLGSPGSADKVRTALTRIDLATGVPVWSRLTHVDSSATAFLTGRAMVIDQEAIFSVTTGTDTSNTQVNTIFLQKTSLEGDLLWVKKYSTPGQITLAGQSILSVADGFLLFGYVEDGANIAETKKIVFKVDKNGNMLWAKTLVLSAGTFNQEVAFSPNNSIIADGRAWFIASSAIFPGADVLLLKMDADGQVSDSCTLIQPLTITAAQVSNPVNTVITVTRSFEGVSSLNTALRSTMPVEMPAATYCLRCSALCQDTLDLGPDVVLCHDSTVTFHAGAGFATYLWQDGSTDSTFVTDSIGLYWVEVTDTCGQTLRDSVLLTVSLLGDTPFPDTTLCAGETLVASVPGFDQYLWTPAAALDCDTCAVVTLQPTISTTYTVLATTGNGCVFRDTFVVAVQPLPTVIQIIEFSPGDTVTIGGVAYTQPDTVHYLQPAAVGCDTLALFYLQFAKVCTAVLDLGPDVVLCHDSTVTFQAGSGFVAYLWQDGSTGPTFSTDSIGLYWVEVTDSCGNTQRDSVLLTVSLLGDTPFPDTAICAGESLTVSLPGFDHYLWTPAAALNCDTCATVTLHPAATTQYTLFASPTEGCVTHDTFLVTVLPLPTRTEVIELFPGDTILLGGVPYSQSDTVVLTVAAATGCDTLVTYVLHLQTTGSLACPNDLTVQVSAGETGTVVDYNLPVAVTNCPDSTFTFTLLSGLPVGGVFPVGTTEVCYAVADACGYVDTCCFTLTVEEEQLPCDVKTLGCLRYELLAIKLDASGNRRYFFRVKNNCAEALDYVAFELPAGAAAAVAPANGTVYNGANGRTYEVRNPNASPFHSIRFRALANPALQLGAAESFEYSLPPQSAPNYLHVTAKVGLDQYFPTLMNTFNCPVQPYSNFSPGNGGAKATTAPAVFPNPTDGVLNADCSAWAGQPVAWRITNAQGRAVDAGSLTADYALQRLALPPSLPKGLYFLELRAGDGQRAVQRFVLQR